MNKQAKADRGAKRRPMGSSAAPPYLQAPYSNLMLFCAMTSAHLAISARM